MQIAAGFSLQNSVVQSNGHILAHCGQHCPSGVIATSPGGQSGNRQRTVEQSISERMIFSVTIARQTKSMNSLSEGRARVVDVRSRSPRKVFIFA